MLESLHIGKSRIRRDLLSLFCTNQSQRYYLRELQRILGYSAGSLRRELLKFQKDSLFHTEQKGNLLYYYINIKHPLFKELKSIVSKTIGLEGNLKKILSSIRGIDTAFIYGSFAEDKENSASDIDLMIIGEPDEDKLMQKIESLEKKLQREINYNIYPKKEFERKIKRRDSFVANILKRPKISLIGSIDGV